MSLQSISGAGGTRTYPEDPQDALRALLGPLMDGLRGCSGGCGQQLLPYSVWQKIGKAERKRLRDLGVNRVSSFGRCWKCAETGMPQTGHGNANYSQRIGKIPQETLDRLPEIWNEILVAGGGTPELGKRLGVTRERARQLVSKYGLPRTHRSKARSLNFIEELEFFVSCGLGVYEIAGRLGMDPDSFVKKVDGLRHDGKTTVEFYGYFREEYAA